MYRERDAYTYVYIYMCYKYIYPPTARSEVAHVRAYPVRVDIIRVIITSIMSMLISIMMSL